MEVMLCRLGMGGQWHHRATVAGLRPEEVAHGPRNTGGLQKLAKVDGVNPRASS